jgi:hypothetical protein
MGHFEDTSSHDTISKAHFAQVCTPHVLSPQLGGPHFKLEARSSTIFALSVVCRHTVKSSDKNMFFQFYIDISSTDIFNKLVFF